MWLPTHPLAVLLTSLVGLSYAAAQAGGGRTRYPIHTRIIAPSSPSSSDTQPPPPPPFQRSGIIETDVDVSTFAVALDGNGEVVLPSARWVPFLPTSGGSQAGVPMEGQEGKAEGKEEKSVVMRDDVWLQIAVEVEGSEEDLWPRTVVRACHLPYANHSTITLHVNTHPPHLPSTSSSSSNASSNSPDLDLESPHPSFQPYAITYRVSDIPADNACRPETRGKMVPKGLIHGGREVEVLLKTRKVVHSPYIPTAAPITTTGAGAASAGPVVEKTFLQKYWLYIAGAGMAVLLVGTQEAPVQG